MVLKPRLMLMRSSDDRLSPLFEKLQLGNLTNQLNNLLCRGKKIIICVFFRILPKLNFLLHLSSRRFEKIALYPNFDVISEYAFYQGGGKFSIPAFN